MAGAKYFQQRIQNMFGLTPVICSTQSLNLKRKLETKPCKNFSLISPEYPANNHSLEKADPEESHA